MQTVPLQAVANQTVFVTLGTQNCQINVYQKWSGLFVDLYVNNSIIVSGVLALNKRYIVISPYLGFSGDLMFIDNIASTDPYYTGLGAQYTLMYLAPADITANYPST